MSRSRQIAINAVSQWTVTTVSAVLGLVLVPFLIAKLGQDGYGLIAVVLAIAGVCTLADLGISGALGRQLAESLARKDEGKYRELLSTALALHLALGLIASSTVFLLAPQLARSFGLPQSLYHIGVFLLKTYGAAHVLFTFLMPSAKAVLASHNRFDKSSQIDAVRRLCDAAGLFLVLASTNAGIVGWAVVCITTDVVSVVLLWRAAAKVHTGLRIGIAMIGSSGLRELFALGCQFSVLQLSGQISTHANPFILTTCLGPASVALYRPPTQILSVLYSVVMTVSGQLHPLATKAHVEGDKRDLIAILSRGTKYAMLMGAVSCAILIPFAQPLCKIWLSKGLGDQYMVCTAVLTIQTITQLCAFAGGTQWAVLLGMKRTAFAAYARMVLALLNIVSSWILVKYTSLGVLGAVLPTMALELVWRPILALYVCRTVKMSFRAYLREAYCSPFLIATVVTFIALGVRLVAPLETLWDLGRATGALTAIAAILVWFGGLTPTDRIGLVNLTKSFLPHRYLVPQEINQKTTL